VKAISFTGGTQTGAHIAKVAAPMFKKLSLECSKYPKGVIILNENLDIKY